MDYTNHLLIIQPFQSHRSTHFSIMTYSGEIGVEMSVSESVMADVVRRISVSSRNGFNTAIRVHYHDKKGEAIGANSRSIKLIQNII